VFKKKDIFTKDFLTAYRKRWFGFHFLGGQFINELTKEDLNYLTLICKNKNKHLYYNGYKFNRLLETDKPLLLPTNCNIKLQITAQDVIHSWAVPSLGVKVDAIPGRVNETWIYIKYPGLFYGQCSELCGVNHAFMPICVEAVPMFEFKERLNLKNLR
jgi:heme/copper-type cytochrome/quinol oxidase subunit 2